MRLQTVGLVLILFLLASRFGFAELAAIHVSTLPQETSVLTAYDDAKRLEEYSSSWSTNWQYPVPKADVAATLSKDVAFLKAATKEHPTNVELLILTGLVAHYAYNLDVDGAYDTVLDVLKRAIDLAPSDVRGPWFRAGFVCSTDKPGPGAEEFLAIEASKPWNQLPIGFWHDYMECAEVVNMPAHVLRADDHLKKLHAPDTKDRAFLVDVARKRFSSVDLTKTYETKEAWYSAKKENDWEFTDTGCGMGIRVHGDWEIRSLEMNEGFCAATLGMGPYKEKSSKLFATLMVMAERPAEHQSLEDLMDTLAKKFQSAPGPTSDCPIQGCLVRNVTKQGSPGTNSIEQGRILVFERDEPEFPGLVFETPASLPTDKQQEGVAYFRPDQILGRIPGKLYYVIYFDTAASIEEPALKDFAFAVQNLTVE